MNPESSDELARNENLSLKLSQDAWKETKYSKIGGLLILVAIGLSISLLQNLGYFLGAIAPIIGSPEWERFTNPGSPEFHPQWKLVIIYDAVTATLIFLLNIFALVLFFRKKKSFPTLVAVLIPIIFLDGLTNHYLSGFIPAIARSAGYAKRGEWLILKFIGLHIWIPYLLLSKRVAKTFVR